MYKSPIELIIADIQHQIAKEQDEEIYKAVVHYIPNIDKEELLRALKYDRNQYEKGYMDGKADAMAELVRCKECMWFDTEDELADVFRKERHCYCTEVNTYVSENHFCSYGERKDNETL